MATPKEIAQQARRLSEEMIIFARMLEGAASSGGPTGAATVEIPEVRQIDKKPPPPAAPARVKHTYQNDPNLPGYDPEPPFQVDKVPPREAPPQGQVVMKAGTIIVCRSCNQPLLKANRDIDNTAVPGRGLSLDAFDFLVPDVRFPESIPLYNEPTGKAVDCPLCHGHKGIWLYGNPPPPADVRTPGGAGSI